VVYHNPFATCISNIARRLIQHMAQGWQEHCKLLARYNDCDAFRLCGRRKMTASMSNVFRTVRKLLTARGSSLPPVLCKQRASSLKPFSIDVRWVLS
jgi:hypothetical protein